MNIVTTEMLPPLIRRGGGKNSEENQQIADFLQDGLSHLITDIEPKSKDFINLSQRIRKQAEKLGINVKIVASDQGLHFQQVEKKIKVATETSEVVEEILGETAEEVVEVVETPEVVETSTRKRNKNN